MPTVTFRPKTRAARSRIRRAEAPEVPATPQARPVRKLPTGVVVLLVVLGALVVGAYVGHVHATEAVLEEVQTLRREHLQLRLRYDRLKGEFDRQTGPEVILDRAKALGLEEGIGYGPTIVVEGK